MELAVQRLCANATIPSRATSGAAGYDITCTETVHIPPNERRLVSTGIRVAIPNGYVGILKSRSSMAWKQTVDVHAGVIDSDYRGEVKILLHNAHPSAERVVTSGERVAQMLVVPVPNMILTESTCLTHTHRGQGGFGSTGA
jgi:dUTP pyrophosphatase